MKPNALLRRGSVTNYLRSLLTRATEKLSQAGVNNPRGDAEKIAAHVWGMTRAEMFLANHLPAHLEPKYWELVRRRVGREPLQHLLGYTGFRFLTLAVKPGVFVPRPETELVAEVVIKHAQQQPHPPIVVDLCTGSGAIAVAVANEVPAARVLAVDISPEAIELTRDNAEGNDVDVQAFVGDVNDCRLLVEYHGKVDVVVANPPYIPQGFEPTDPEVRDFDPPHALFGGGPHGLDLPTAVIARAQQLLKSGGIVVMEHGDNQAEDMRSLVNRNGGFHSIGTRNDLTNRERMVIATRGEVAD